MKPLPDVPASIEKGIDAVFSTLRGFVALKGTPEARLDLLEEKLLRAMKHEDFQEHLRKVGLSEESVAGRAEWEAQFRKLYETGIASLRDLGLH